jgi:tryptophan-rich sensory protein
VVRADASEFQLVAGILPAAQNGLGALNILTLLATIVGFIAVQIRENRLAAGLFVPYAAWVAFASALNYSLLKLN